MKQVIHPLVLFLCGSATAQNFVPNPGFEDMVRMPSRYGNQVSCSRHWRSPTGSGTDYYHFEADRHAGTPRNIFGRQRPHDGQAYGGICLKGSYMEYLAITLRDTLKPDTKYLVEFYVSRADRSIGRVGQFGAMFINRKQWSFREGSIIGKPQLDFTNWRKFKRKMRWTKLSGVYEANGDEVTLILGYFNYEPRKRCRTFCHYYIDDVSVTPVSEEADEPAVLEEVPETPLEKAVTVFDPKPGEAITLQNIFFATGKSELLPGSFPELDKLVAFLAARTEMMIEISGHTDNTGTESLNLALSEARAEAIADYLLSNNIDESRISAKGYGSARPVADNATEEGRQKNRRVEFVVIPADE